MGTCKDFVAFRVCKEAQLYWHGDVACRDIKALDGTVFSITGYKGSEYYGSYNHFYIYDTTMQDMYMGLSPIATEDKLEDYHLDDYEITALGTTTFARQDNFIADLERNMITFSINVANDTEQPIVIKCIKFKKALTNYSSMNDFLVFAYYLDEDEYYTVPTGKSVSFVFTITSEDEAY